MFPKNKIIHLFTIILFFGLSLIALNSCKIKSNSESPSSLPINSVENQIPTHTKIDQLTEEKVVIEYLIQHKKLPDYYIKKSEAKEKGWVPSEGNLCVVLPNRAIGGDYFSNRQKILPHKKGRKYFEADINFQCGRRGPERLVFSNDGLIFSTKDHYSTFKKINHEENSF